MTGVCVRCYVRMVLLTVFSSLSGRPRRHRTTRTTDLLQQPRDLSSRCVCAFVCAHIHTHTHTKIPRQAHTPFSLGVLYFLFLTSFPPADWVQVHQVTPVWMDIPAPVATRDPAVTPDPLEYQHPASDPVGHTHTHTHTLNKSLHRSLDQSIITRLSIAPTPSVHLRSPRVTGLPRDSGPQGRER